MFRYKIMSIGQTGLSLDLIKVEINMKMNYIQYFIYTLQANSRVNMCVSTFVYSQYRLPGISLGFSFYIVFIVSIEVHFLWGIKNYAMNFNRQKKTKTKKNISTIKMILYRTTFISIISGDINIHI